MAKGFKESGLRLNTWIAAQTQWTLDELEKRSDMMMQKAVQIWAAPETAYAPAEKQLDAYSLEDDVDLSGREIIRFSYKNTEQPIGSWILMMEQILKILHAEDKSVLTRLAHTHNPDDELDAYVSDNPADLRGALEIEPGIYLERNTSTSTKIAILKKFFNAFGANPEDLVFYLKDQATVENADEAGTMYETRRKYWAFALPYIKEAHGTEGSFKNVNTSKQYWINGGIGISGFSISCEAKMNRTAVTLVLGKSDRNINKSAYDFLLARKAEIESQLGVPLNWWRFEGKSSYVDYGNEEIGISDETCWLQMAKFHAEWSKKFYDVFVPLLQQWNVER